MSRMRYQTTLWLELESPFLSRGLTAAGFGIDMAQARDADGKVVLPGDMILGNLRQAVRDLDAPDTIALLEDLFGRQSDDEDSNAPRRGHIVIADLVAQTLEPDQGGAMTRVKIDDATGSVAHGALAVVELPYPLGQRVQFKGEVLFWAEPGKLDAVLSGLRDALALIPAVGALKSVGFGWVVSVSLDQPSATDLAPPMPRLGVDGRVELTLHLDRPFLVDAERLAQNVFQGREVIPGAVLKGALATRLARAGCTDFDDDLSNVVFGHALPSCASQAPLPFSLATDQDCAVFSDFLLDDGPRLIGNSVPVFAPDWKDENAVRALLGWEPVPEFAYDTRTRTAIDGETGTSLESQLFSYAAIIAGQNSWHCVLDQGGADEAAFRTIVAMLEQGLDGIGKTGARARITVRPAQTPTARALPSGQWALCLRTPALLNDPQALRDGTTLFDDYARYWETKLDARLVRFFARQRLAGGYQGLRFRRDKASYQPFLLTEPGSVFLLEGNCQDRLDHLLRRNLPPRPDGVSWRTCPFMPENGFGAFCLNAGVPHV